MKIEFIEPEDLRYRIESNDQNFHIIDLRDYDYSVGYIRTPTEEQYHHITTEEFTTEVVKQLISENVLSSNSRVDFIFHCFYSQQRGPTAAMKMSNILKNLDDSNSDVESRIGVKVLRGGWGLWNTRFYNDEKVIVKLPDSEEEESTSDEDDDEY
ncbi:hypothetical protein FDP41_010996 [Naegleria fowleri]|uniref:Rhodanese domain-containing protein n=1 Tax=Naegleria fowleri TaxID=5763 RepID=A0A6A5CBQ6_NAEFO|nr:uncharacterized protein FDP41_010996 [Naegleria fowleri]KAF0983018.1 hypothetical protein FDP41_010996 [Naegleria fowleri]CAG4716263.1 unnamed protein product [Naegleria fowleri]